MIFRLAFGVAFFAALWLIFSNPIKRYLKEKNPFTGYNPLKTDVYITWTQGDTASEFLARQLETHLSSKGIVAIVVARPVGLQVSNTESISGSNVVSEGNVQIQVEKSN